TLTLYYRNGDEGVYQPVAMSQRLAELVGRIPAAVTRSRTVHYYIEARAPDGKLAASSGKANAPNVIYIDPAAPAHYYRDAAADTFGEPAPPPLPPTAPPPPPLDRPPLPIPVPKPVAPRSAPVAARGPPPAAASPSSAPASASGSPRRATRAPSRARRGPRARNVRRRRAASTPTRARTSSPRASATRRGGMSRSPPRG